MLSKLSLAAMVALMTENTNALTQITETYDASRSDAASASGYGCGECILKGFNFVTNKWGQDVTEYAGKCCEAKVADNTCVDTNYWASGSFKTGYDESSTWSKDIAVTKCPQKQSVCGTTKAFSFQSPADTKKQAKVTSQVWTQQDQCTYTIDATCGAPSWDFEGLHDGSIDAEFSANDVYIHYLEHDDASKGYANTDKPPTTDGLEGYSVGSLWNLGLKITPMKYTATKQTLSVPGEFAAAQITQYNADVAAFDKAKAKFIEDEKVYKKYVADKAAYDAQDVFKKFWSWLTATGQVAFVGIPVWPPLPPAYSGYKIGKTEGDLIINGGYGSLSAGMLSFPNATHSFGTIGGSAEFTYKEIAATPTAPASKQKTRKVFGGASVPFVHPEQNIYDKDGKLAAANCKKNTALVTMISKGTFSAKKSFVMDMKALDWNTKISLTPAASPTAATKPTIAARK